MRPLTVLSSLLLLLAQPVPASAQDELPPQAKNGKVCVAIVANASTQPATVERLAERLVKNLQSNKTSAVVMDSATTNQRRLQPTRQNGEESQQKECDYVLLTQITDPRQHPEELPSPRISIGGRPPSIDASDPLGGSSGPVHRDNLQVNFALFRQGRFKPVLDTYLLAEASANVSDSFLQAMDREANRVSQELNKK